MKAAFLALLMLMLAAPPAMGQTGVLISPLPRDLEPAQVLAAARHVLEARDWHVSRGEGGRSLIADNDASTLRILIEGDELRYADRVRRTRPGGGRQRNRESNEPLAAVPQAEIDAIRAALTTALANPPAIATGASTETRPEPRGQVLLDGVQGDPARVMDKVRIALASRGWKLSSTEGGTVVARNRSGELDASLLIQLSDGILRYIDRSSRDRGGRAQVPERWIAYLRADLSKSLREISPTAAAVRAETRSGRVDAAAAMGNAAERLRRLQGLLDSGAITPDEYMKKRVEILKDL